QLHSMMGFYKNGAIMLAKEVNQLVEKLEVGKVYRISKKYAGTRYHNLKVQVVEISKQKVTIKALESIFHNGGACVSEGSTRDLPPDCRLFNDCEEEK